MHLIHRYVPFASSPLVFWSSVSPVIRSSVLIVLLSQSSEALLLGNRVDICSDEEGDDVEEWDPGVLGKELLCECKSKWGCDPADFHDRPESSLPGCMNLMDGLRTGNDSHRDQINTVLDRGNLGIK